jgi:hypothetical protein
VTKSPDEFRDERRDEQTKAPSDSADHDSQLISFEFYGIKGKMPPPTIGPVEEPKPNTTPKPRAWRLVWRDCIAHLQDSMVGVASLLSAIPRSTVSLVDSISTVGQSVGELAKRVARGRARADHNEDERIADAEADSDPMDTNERQARTENALSRLSDLERMICARGGEIKRVQTTDNRLIVLVVPPDAQRAVLERANARLLEHHLSEAAQKGQGRSEAQLDSILPRRIVNALKSHGITTLDQLGKLTIDDVVKFRGIGAKSLHLLEPFLAPRRPLGER